MVVELGVSEIDLVDVVKHQVDRLDFNISCLLWYMNTGAAPVVVSKVTVRSGDGEIVPVTEAEISPPLKAEPTKAGETKQHHHTLKFVGVKSPRLLALPRDTDGKLNTESLAKAICDAKLELGIPGQPKGKVESIW